MDHLNLLNVGQKTITPKTSNFSFIETKTNPFSGPLSKEMWKKVNALNSSMPDEFDWSVYDGLYNKFGENQLKGSVLKY